MSNYKLGAENTAYLGKQGLSFSNQFAIDAYGIGYLQGLVFADKTDINLSSSSHTILPITDNQVDLTAVNGGWTLHKDRIEFKDTNSDSSKTRLYIAEGDEALFLAANKIKFSASAGLNEIPTANVSFIPGDYKDSRTGCFKFSMPLWTPNIRLGSEGVRYLTLENIEDKDKKPQYKYFYIGPNRTDANNETDAYKPALSVLRGTNLTLQAFGGDKDDKFLGNIRLKAKNTILLNKSYLKGINSDGKTSIIAFLDSASSSKPDDHHLSGDTKARRNRVIIGAANNAGQLELRSGDSVLIKTRGTVTDGRKYSSRVFQFATLDFDASKNTKKLRGCFRPMNSGFARLGSPNFKWYKVYADHFSATSDRKYKKNIESLNESYIKFFDALEPVKFQWQNSDENRFKTGFIAQDVETALHKAGLSDHDFAALEKDLDENNPNDYIYGLDYTGFIAPMVLKIKQLEQIIEQQQEQIHQLLELR